MAQTQPSRLSSSNRAAIARAFADWLADRMRERGYDLSARGGGQARLAEQTGLGRTTISRILRGDAHNPDPESLRKIADVLALPFGDMLVRAGILTTEELRTTQTSRLVTDRPPLTPEQAAEELGFTDPAEVQLLTAYVNALRRQRPDDRA